VLSTTGRESVFAAMACVTAAAWLVVALGLREHYLNIFRETLHEEAGGGSSDFPTLDMASLETLLATLNSPDDRRVVAALDVLREQGKAGVVPALILYHPSPLVVERALDVFVWARREDILPLTERLLAHAEPGVRAGSVRARLVLGPDRATLEACAQDPDAGVALTALAGLVGLGLDERDVSRQRLVAEVLQADAGTRETVARAVQLLPHAVLEPLLQNLLADPEPGVALRAVAAAREMHSPGLISPLLLLLPRRLVREEARVALAVFGPSALARLGEALVDPELSHTIRRHVPGAIGMIGSVQAPELLLRHLRQEPDGMIRFKVLRALGRWRNSQPPVALDADLLEEILRQALTTGFRLMGWRRALERGGVGAPALRTELHQILVALLRDKQDHALERAFRLLNLQTGSEEFQTVFRGLHSPREATRAGSRELLEHLVLPHVRGPLLTLADDLQGGSSVAEESGWQSAAGVHRAYARVLDELVACGMESVSSLAAGHAAELGFVELGSAVERCRAVSEEHQASLTRAAGSLRGEVT